ncbi:MAG: ABC transporter permease [Steroidobacteraceae bacterium]
MIRRLLSVWHARNLEFVRDRGTLVFTLLLPVSIIIGMGFIFGGSPRPLFKVGVIGGLAAAHGDAFLRTHYVQFIRIDGEPAGLHAIDHQRIDLLLAPGEPPHFWVNTDSPKGYITEKLLLAADPGAQREPVSGHTVRYLDWLFPGILGMNMMFSCLFGVGYVVLRYRQSGFLKRLNATPLSALEFLSAQVLSRLTIIVIITTVLYLSVGAMIHFHSAGSLALLLLLTVLGALSMIALGLTIAARFASEELVNGILNLLTWPMMLLSGVWFSLAGSPKWVQWIADALPLTQLLHAAREVMLYGAGIGTIAPSLLYLSAVTAVFLAFGAWSFKWRI